MRSWNVALIAAALLLFTRDASAACRTTEERCREDAKALFAVGSNAWSSGDYATAARSWEEAARLVPNVQAWKSAGDAWRERASVDATSAPRAATAYERAIALGLRDEAVEAFMGEARSSLARLRTSRLEDAGGRRLAATMSVDYVIEEPVPAPDVYLQPGPHEVVLVRSSGETVRIREDLSPAEVWEPKLPVAPETPPRPPRPPRPPPGRSHTLGIVGITLLSVGVAAGATAVGTGVATLGHVDDFEQSRLRDVEAHDRAVSFRLATNLLAFGGAIVGSAGVTLILLEDWSEPQLIDGSSRGGRTSLVLTPSGVGLRGAFR